MTCTVVNRLVHLYQILYKSCKPDVLLYPINILSSSGPRITSPFTDALTICNPTFTLSDVNEPSIALWRLLAQVLSYFH